MSRMPCQGEQGIGDPQANRHGRMAVESRMNPVFVHDPRRGPACTAASRSRAIPPSTRTGRRPRSNTSRTAQTKLLDVPLTPADFALTEGRFSKQFRELRGGRSRRSGPRMH